MRPAIILLLSRRASLFSFLTPAPWRSKVLPLQTVLRCQGESLFIRPGGCRCTTAEGACKQQLGIYSPATPRRVIVSSRLALPARACNDMAAAGRAKSGLSALMQSQACPTLLPPLPSRKPSRLPRHEPHNRAGPKPSQRQRQQWQRQPFGAMKLASHLPTARRPRCCRFFSPFVSLSGARRCGSAWGAIILILRSSGARLS